MPKLLTKLFKLSLCMSLNTNSEARTRAILFSAEASRGELLSELLTQKHGEFILN